MAQHIIFQTGNFSFFNSLQWRSIAWLELLQKTEDFIYVDVNAAPRIHAEAIEKLGAQRWNLSDYWNNGKKHKTFAELQAEINTYLDSLHDLKTINFYNGCTCINFEDELKVWEMYQMCKQEPNKDLWKSVKKPYVNSIWMMMYCMLEWCAAHHIRVNNVFEDPLQHKLEPYIEGLDVHNYYFHFLPKPDAEVNDGHAMTYTHPAKTRLSPTFKVDFCPSQQYWYMMCQHRTEPFAVNTKDIKFCFAMTDNWAVAKDRQQLIFAIEHMAAPGYFEQTGILFKYTSIVRAPYTYKYCSKLMPYEVYMQHIKRSKFTLNIPSYDTSCFSLRRFFEAMSNDCIPLILDTCNYKEGFNCNQEFIDIVEKYLLVSMQDMQNFEAVLADKLEHYDEILSAIKTSTYWKAYSNPKLYKKHLAKMFDLANAL